MRVNGENLKRIRKKKAIRQEELACAIGLSQAMVSQLEKGARNVGWQTLENISMYLGCGLEDITEEGEPSPYTQVMRDIKKLSESQVEVISNLIKEFLKTTQN